MVMKNIYKDLYLESNGDIILIEKNIMGERNIINISDKVRELK